MKPRFLLPLWLLALASGTSMGAEFTLSDGTALTGAILDESASQYVISRDYGTISINKSAVAKVNKETPPKRETPVIQHSGAIFPSWQRIVIRASGQPWVKDFQQIPATVIDNGVFENVPYLSFRFSENYELNIYGDPDSPAAVEMGLYRTLANDPDAQQNCITFIGALSSDSRFQRALTQMSKSGSSNSLSGVVIEITPPSAPDAYNGWWVSIYDPQQLKAVRASKVDLKNITLEKQEIQRAPARAVVTGPGYTEWASSDLRYARPAARHAPVVVPNRVYTPPQQTYTPSSSGRVYVRGYYRKDGTYVRPHTRRR